MARPATTDPQTEAVLKRLDALAECAPDLAEPIAFYRAVLPALRSAQATVEPFTLMPEAAQRKLESGLPLLVGEDLPLDAEATRDLFLRLCRITESIDVSSNGNGKNTRKRNRSRWPFSAHGRPDSLALMERPPALGNLGRTCPRRLGAARARGDRPAARSRIAAPVGPQQPQTGAARLGAGA